MPTGGARFFYRRLPGPGSEIMTRFRTAGPAAMLVQVGLRGPDWLGLSLVATWNQRHDRLFAGMGPNTEEELEAAGQGRARYGFENLGAELLWSRRLPWRLVARARGGLDRRDYHANDVIGGPSVADLYGVPADVCAARGVPAPCVDEAEMPGFYRGLRIARAGGGLVLDLRNPARDGGGFSLAADATFAQGLAGDPSRHATYVAETVAAIGGNDRLFLLRARATMVERLGAAPIPFEELVIPSGMIDMRGFPDGRLRDASGLVGSAEYRWYISAYLDATLFVDVGTVAGPRFAGLRRHPLVPELRRRLPLLPAPGRPLGGARGRRHPDRLRARGRVAFAADDGSVLTMGAAANAYWSRSVEDVAREVGSGAAGLDPDEAARRLAAFGPNALAPERALSSLRLLYEQVKSPLILILVFAAVVSIAVAEYTDSAVVLAIMVTSTGIGFWRERGARDAIARLRARLTLETDVIRGGVQRRIPAADVVPGDLVVLSAGALVPADGLLWEATDLHVNEAILTGETFPAEKRPGRSTRAPRSRRAPTPCSWGPTSAPESRASSSWRPGGPPRTAASRDACACGRLRRSSIGACASSASFSPAR